MKSLTFFLIFNICLCYSQNNNQFFEKNDSLIKPFKVFYDSGVLKISGFKKYSLNEGVWLYYDEKGGLFYKAIYKSGKIIYENYLNHKYGQFKILENDSI